MKEDGTKDTRHTRENLEMRILGSIKRLQRGIDILIKLQLEILSNRSVLRNQIIAYEVKHGENGLDDLLHAIIKDDALPKEEIFSAFDMNDYSFSQALERLQERENNKI